MKGESNCEACMNYIYDEEFECYICDMDLDQDEMGRFLTNTFENCPYFRLGDEYMIVRKQMQTVITVWLWLNGYSQCSLWGEK